MIPTTYATTCPKCGQQLAPVALGPSTAPWLCAECGRGFWSSELSKEARDVYRPQYNDWGYTSRVPIHAAVELEIADAHQRGTSLREDQFVYATPALLDSVKASKRVHSSFVTAIETHLTNMGPA